MMTNKWINLAIKLLRKLLIYAHMKKTESFTCGSRWFLQLKTTSIDLLEFVGHKQKWTLL